MCICRLCGGFSTKVAEYDLGKLGGFWAKADCETRVEIRKCTRFGSFFTATIPRYDLLIGQYLIDHGEFYDDPSRKPDARAERCVAQVIPFLKAGQSVLDVGGGNGAFAFLAASKGLKALFQEHGKIPTESLLSAGVTVVNSLDEIPSGSVDSVSLWDVYEHVWPHDEFLLPIKRVLKRRGLLFVEIPSPSNLVPIFVALSRVLPSPRSERALAQICNYTHLQLMTPNELRHSLEMQGFSVQHLTGLSELSYRGVAYAERLIAWKLGAKAIGTLFDNARLRRTLLGRNKTFAVAQIV
jgi:2-polyprenyl-3-methyl-5-hydroxy-6-metoxy-1,4-benzoquinol methylase